jgi:hypothetical protein
MAKRLSPLSRTQPPDRIVYTTQEQPDAEQQSEFVRFQKQVAIYFGFPSAPFSDLAWPTLLQEYENVSQRI